MNILLFCSANLSLGSGSEVRARLLAEGLHACGHRVCVVAGGLPKHFHNIGVSGHVTTPSPKLFSELAALAKAHAADVVIGVTEAYADHVAQAARQANAKLVFDAHGIGAIEVLELGRGYGPRLQRCLQSLCWVKHFRQADLVISANPMLTNLLRHINRRTQPIVGLTDTSHFSPDGPKAIVGTSESRLQVLYIGNYFRWQGAELLLDAIEALGSTDAYEFTLIGSVGSGQSHARKRLAALSSANVHVLDQVPFEDVGQWFRGADVFIIPRPWMFSTYLAFPQKLVDAMASGCTILATDLAPHRHALGDGARGMLCPATADGIIKGLNRLRDTSVRSAVSGPARSYAVAEFSHFVQANRLSDLLANL